MSIEERLNTLETSISEVSRNLIRKINVESQRITKYEEILIAKKEEIATASETIKQLTENKFRLEKELKTTQGRIESLKKSNGELKKNVLRLRREEEKKSQALEKERKMLNEKLSLYREKWNERYQTRYANKPWVQKLEKVRQILMEVTENLKCLKSDLRQCQADVFKAKCERGRRNAEESGYYPLQSFIVKIARIGWETAKLNREEITISMHILNLQKDINARKNDITDSEINTSLQKERNSAIPNSDFEPPIPSNSIEIEEMDINERNISNVNSNNMNFKTMAHTSPLLNEERSGKIVMKGIQLPVSHIQKENVTNSKKQNSIGGKIRDRMENLKLYTPIFSSPPSVEESRDMISPTYIPQKSLLQKGRAISHPFFRKKQIQPTAVSMPVTSALFENQLKNKVTKTVQQGNIKQIISINRAKSSSNDLEESVQQETSTNPLACNITSTNLLNEHKGREYKTGEIARVENKEKEAGKTYYRITENKVQYEQIQNELSKDNISVINDKILKDDISLFSNTQDENQNKTNNKSINEQTAVTMENEDNRYFSFQKFQNNHILNDQNNLKENKGYAIPSVSKVAFDSAFTLQSNMISSPKIAQGKTSDKFSNETDFTQNSKTTPESLKVSTYFESKTKENNKNIDHEKDVGSKHHLFDESIKEQISISDINEETFKTKNISEKSNEKSSNINISKQNLKEQIIQENENQGEILKNNIEIATNESQSSQNDIVQLQNSGNEQEPHTESAMKISICHSENDSIQLSTGTGKTTSTRSEILPLSEEMQVAPLPIETTQIIDNSTTERRDINDSQLFYNTPMIANELEHSVGNKHTNDASFELPAKYQRLEFATCTPIPDKFQQTDHIETTSNKTSPFNFENHMKILGELNKSPHFTYPSRLMYSMKEKAPVNQEHEELNLQNSRDLILEPMSFINNISITPATENNSKTFNAEEPKEQTEFLSFAYEDYLNDSPPTLGIEKEKSMFSFGQDVATSSVKSPEFFPLFAADTEEMEKETKSAKSDFIFNFDNANKTKSPENDNSVFKHLF